MMAWKRILLLAMTGLMATVLCGAAPLAAVTNAPAQASSTPRTVTTTGEAEILVAPDEVILTLGVETSDKQLSVAKRLHDEQVAGVLAAAEGLGVATQYLQTDHIGIEPRYRDSYEQRSFIGYFVRQTIVITLKEISAFDDVLTATLEAGAGYVHGIQFQTSELRKYRDEARVQAIRAAHEKAIALAGELGQKVGRPIEIREEQAQWYSSYNSWWGGRGGMMTQNVIQEIGGASMGDLGTLSPGQISVTARVTVSFEME